MKPNSSPSLPTPTGILLAAGKGTRFDASGMTNKLLTPLTQGPEVGLPIGFVAARRMRNALSRVIAVVDAHSPDGGVLAEWLGKAGCEVVAINNAGEGMGASLAAAIRASLAPAAPQGWVIGLADMPMIAPATIQALALRLQADEDIVAPVFEGRRGHPVVFGRAHGPVLMSLTGDTGARELIDTHGYTALDTGDAGVVRDIDTASDL